MKNKGYIYAVLSAVFFGSAGLFIKEAYKTGLSATSLLTEQYIIAVLLMLIISLIKNRRSLIVSKIELKSLFVLGVLGNTMMTIFYYKAFERLPVAMVAMLLYTYPVMVLIYSVAFQNRKLTYNKLIAIIASIFGAVISLGVINGKSYDIIGVLYGILAAVFYSFMNIYSEEKLGETEPLTINFYSTLFTLFVLILIKLPVLTESFKFDEETLISVTSLAFFCEIIPLTLLYSAIKYIGSFKMSIIGNLEIPTAILVSVLFLREHITTYEIIGSILIIFAANLVKTKDKKNLKS